MCVYMSFCAPHIYRNPWKPRKGIRSPGPGVTHDCKQPHGY